MRHENNNKVAPSAEKDSSAFKGRLTDLAPEVVRALPAELRDLWDKQSDEEGDDFFFMQRVAERVYPLLRKAHKRERDEQLGVRNVKSMDDPFYAAIGEFLSFADHCQNDPMFLERLRYVHARRASRDKGKGIEAKATEQADVAAKGMPEAEAEAFVKEWLPGVCMFDVGGWAVGELRDGGLVACPVCHFLHFSTDACRVCASRPQAARHMFESGVSSELFTEAAERLMNNRVEVAEHLHDLYLVGHWAAENVIIEAMQAQVRAAQSETEDKADATV